MNHLSFPDLHLNNILAWFSGQWCALISSLKGFIVSGSRMQVHSCIPGYTKLALHYDTKVILEASFRRYSHWPDSWTYACSKEENLIVVKPS